MPTVPEHLQQTHVLIKQSDEFLEICRRRDAEIQAQIEASRKTISESLEVLQAHKAEEDSN